MRNLIVILVIIIFNLFSLNIVFNKQNASLSTVNSPSPTPYKPVKILETGFIPPVEEIKTITNRVQIAPTATPIPTQNPLPTSVQTNNVRCPDGYGGYVIESQESCNDRMQRLSNELKAAAEAFGNSIVSQPWPTLPPYQTLPDYTTNLPVFQPVPTVHIEIKPQAPTPCPEGFKLYDANNMYASPQCRP